MKQNFLPIRTKSGLVLGVAPLQAETEFTSASTTATLVDASIVNVVWLTKPNDGVEMAVIEIEETQTRNRRWHVSIPSAILITDVILDKKWISIKGLVNKELLSDQHGVLHFLATGYSLSAISVAAPVAPVANNMTVNWTISAEFIGLQACSFLDVNWLELTKSSLPDLEPVSASIGSPTPSGIATHIKPYVVQQPVAYGAGGVLNTTLRFIKVRGDDPTPGSYVYPLVITSSRGVVTTVNVTLVVA
jgi:hypothetical protein